ncbi:MAG: hypothetical protein KDB61_07385 [Planctomycetes bacterium]|nr:hypothetical protein [Planctomycetota bacterium]
MPQSRPVYASLVSVPAPSANGNHPVYEENYSNLDSLAKDAAKLTWTPADEDFSEANAIAFLNAQVGAIWASLRGTDAAHASNSCTPKAVDLWETNTNGIVYFHPGKDGSPDKYAYAMVSGVFYVAQIYVQAD